METAHGVVRIVRSEELENHRFGFPIDRGDEVVQTLDLDARGHLGSETPPQDPPGESGGLAGGLLQGSQDAHDSFPVGGVRCARGWARS